MSLERFEKTQNMKRKDPDGYQRLVKRLLCNELVEEFDAVDFTYEPESSRNDSMGIKRAKSWESLEITESRLRGLNKVIEYLGLEKNLTEEGIFRKSGSLKKQQDLMERIDRGEEISFENSDFTTHECASVLKTFLGNLSEPLVTNSCYLAHLQVALLSEQHGQEDQAAVLEKQIFCTQLLLELIPEKYLKVLKDLLFLLHCVSLREEQNRMSSSNLGMIFSTHILCPRSLPPEELQSKVGLFTKAATFLIENPLTLFTLPEQLLCEVHSCRKRLAKRRAKQDPRMESLVANTVLNLNLDVLIVRNQSVIGF